MLSVNRLQYNPENMGLPVDPDGIKHPDLAYSVDRWFVLVFPRIKGPLPLVESRRIRSRQPML